MIFKAIKFSLFLLFFSMLTSCRCDPDVFVLTGEELSYQPYAVGDVLFFENQTSGDVLELNVISEDIRDYEEGGFKGHGPRFCSGDSDDDHQERILSLSSSLGCTVEYTVGTEGDPAAISFSIFNCDLDVSGNQPFLFQDGIAEVNGITYNPVYRLSNSSSTILVTPNIGILSFVDRNTGDEYVIID